MTSFDGPVPVRFWQGFPGPLRPLAAVCFAASPYSFPLVRPQDLPTACLAPTAALTADGSRRVTDEDSSAHTASASAAAGEHSVCLWL